MSKKITVLTKVWGSGENIVMCAILLNGTAAHSLLNMMDNFSRLKQKDASLYSITFHGHAEWYTDVPDEHDGVYDEENAILIGRYTSSDDFLASTGPTTIEISKDYAEFNTYEDVGYCSISYHAGLERGLIEGLIERYGLESNHEKG